jgi:transposase-like protein
MARYDKNFKLLCIHNLEQGKELPKVNGVKKRTIYTYTKLWQLLLKQKGEEALEDGFIKHEFTLNDKIKAVKLVIKGKSMNEVGRMFGMRTHSCIRRWYLAYMNEGIAGLQYRKGIKPSTSVEVSTPMKKRLSKSEREELLALRKRNEILELENEYLKKLDALVSKREKEEAKAKKQK